jgi:hypothetical protein
MTDAGAHAPEDVTDSGSDVEDADTDASDKSKGTLKCSFSNGHDLGLVCGIHSTTTLSSLVVQAFCPLVGGQFGPAAPIKGTPLRPDDSIVSISGVDNLVSCVNDRGCLVAGPGWVEITFVRPAAPSSGDRDKGGR